MQDSEWCSGLAVKGSAISQFIIQNREIVLHQAGIFTSSVLVGIVNYIGVPLLFIYVCSMFLYPWLSGQGDWIHVQAVWDRWQTLNAGALAFLASLIAFNIARFNENLQREREFVAAKAFLPSTLSGLMEYLSCSATIYEALWSANDQERRSFDLPLLPQDYREVFSDCIRHANATIGSYLSHILVLLQVHDARLHEAEAETSDGQHRVLDRTTLIAYLYRVGELYVLMGNLFGFARHEEPFKNRHLTWDDFRNAYGILKIDVDDFFVSDTMNLQAFVGRALARHNSTFDAQTDA